MLNKRFLSNIFYAFGAQSISLILSLMLSLLVPKILGVNEFGYWQLFIFYSSYITFFHFGLNDGIYLINGGKNKKELDLSEIKSTFIFSVIMEFAISLVILFIVQFLNFQVDREFVVIQTLINFVLYCAANYWGYVFQAINETRVFSISVIINKICFIIFLAIILLMGISDYQIIIYSYNVAQALSLIYCFVKSRDVLRSPSLSIRVTLRNVALTISVGSKLMLANIASMLILGISRFLVDKNWGITIFSKFSFALTLVNFFLLFINQFSMVMFPALRTISSKRQKDYYYFFNDALDIILPGIFILYFPIKFILASWLPDYGDSIYYLGFLLPLCSSNGKMQMINATYLKVLRKEKKLLQINLLTVFISILLSFISIYIMDSMNALLLSLVFITWIRNLLSESFLKKEFKLNSYGYITDAILIIIYLCSISLLKFEFGFWVYLLGYSLFLISKRKELNIIIYKLKNRKI